MHKKYNFGFFVMLIILFSITPSFIRTADVHGQLFADRLIANGQRNLNLVEYNSTNYYMTWEQVRPQNQSIDILFKYTNNSGESFSNNITLSKYSPKVPLNNTYDNNTSTYTTFVKAPTISFDPQIAIFKNQIHVVWQGYVNETDKINVFYTFSNDGGKTFSSPVDISKSILKDTVDPRLIVNKETGKVFIVFLDEEGPQVPCRIRCH